MNTIPISLRLACAAAVLLLAACSEPSAPSPKAVKPSAPPAEAVHRIRAAGADMDSAVQVQPLANPAVDDLMKKARDAEALGDYRSAEDAAKRALALSPDSPDILQYEAEVAALRGEWKDAESLAIESFTKGPKLGSLCARNWQTVVEARTVFKDAATVAQAKQRLKECRIAPPVRM